MTSQVQSPMQSNQGLASQASLYQRSSVPASAIPPVMAGAVAGAYVAGVESAWQWQSDMVFWAFALAVLLVILVGAFWTWSGQGCDWHKNKKQVKWGCNTACSALLAILALIIVAWVSYKAYVMAPMSGIRMSVGGAFTVLIILLLIWPWVIYCSCSHNASCVMGVLVLIALIWLAISAWMSIGAMAIIIVLVILLALYGTCWAWNYGQLNCDDKKHHKGGKGHGDCDDDDDDCHKKKHGERKSRSHSRGDKGHDGGHGH